jgi:glycosyltransferase involved in cell wall biosynthesis
MWRSLLPGRGGGSLNAPRVDVVIPTRNRRSLVFDSIGDALHQEGVEVRCIVVDDGSTDSTAAAIEGEADPRVVLVSHPERRGVSASRNTGMLHSRAPWVAFLDDDDRWAPTKLSAQLAALEAESGARWAATGCVVTDATLHVTGAQALPGGGGEILVRLLIDCFIPAGGSSVLAARSLLDEAGAFDTQLGAVEDWDYWLRLARLSPIAYVHSPLVAYRRWPGNTSGNTALMERYRNEFKLRSRARRRSDGRQAGSQVGPVDGTISSPGRPPPRGGQTVYPGGLGESVGRSADLRRCVDRRTDCSDASPGHQRPRSRARGVEGGRHALA